MGGRWGGRGRRAGGVRGRRWGSAPDPARGMLGFHIVAHDVRSVWKPTCAVFDSSTGGKRLRSPWTPTYMDFKKAPRGQWSFFYTIYRMSSCKPTPFPRRDKRGSRGSPPGGGSRGAEPPWRPFSLTSQHKQKAPPPPAGKEGGRERRGLTAFRSQGWASLSHPISAHPRQR